MDTVKQTLDRQIDNEGIHRLQDAQEMKEKKIQERYKDDPDLAARRIKEMQDNDRREMALGYYPEARLNDNMQKIRKIKGLFIRDRLFEDTFKLQKKLDKLKAERSRHSSVERQSYKPAESTMTIRFKENDQKSLPNIQRKSPKLRLSETYEVTKFSN